MIHIPLVCTVLLPVRMAYKKENFVFFCDCRLMWLSGVCCRVMAVGWWLSGLSCQVLAVGRWLSGDGCRVIWWLLSGDGCRVLAVGCWLLGVGCRALAVGCRLSGVGCRLLVFVVEWSCRWELFVGGCRGMMSSTGCWRWKVGFDNLFNVEHEIYLQFSIQ